MRCGRNSAGSVSNGAQIPCTQMLVLPHTPEEQHPWPAPEPRSPFLPWSFCTPPPVQDGKQKKFLHPTEQGKEQSSQHRPISKLSVLKSPKYPAFNLYCRQRSAAVERASPDLLDTPTPTVNGQCITFLAGIAPSCLCFWSLHRSNTVTLGVVNTEEKVFHWKIII